MSKYEAKLKEMGIVLPELVAPAANFIPYRIAGDLVYLSGSLPTKLDGTNYTGKVGSDLTLDEGYQAARTCGIRLLSCLKQACGGNLDKVDKVIKLLGFVACAPDFYEPHKVVNGCSDLLVEAFGEAGRHARSAIPTCQLPMNVSVEIELIVQLKK